MRAGAGLSTSGDARSAAEEAACAAGSGAGRADAALVFATAEHEQAMETLLDVVGTSLGTRALAGGTAHGVIGAGREVEGGPGLLVLALSGIEATPFMATAVDARPERVGDEILAHLVEPRAEDLVVMVPDPRSVPLHRVLEDLGERLGPATLVGAGAADPLWDRPLQWCDRDVECGAVSGMLLRGARPPRLGVTQACRPVAEPATVTRSNGHWILELDGRPALDAYREAALGPLADDLRRAAAFVLAAIPRDVDASLAPGSYVVRNLAGFDLEAGAFAIPEQLAPGDRLAFAVRDPESARSDMKEMLAGLDTDDAGAGIYFDCCARGESFFGVSGLEAGYLEQALGPIPVGGMFGACEIGPVGGRPELLTYTGVLALL